MLSVSMVQADEGGISFWLPGQYGSFAAVAPEPGFSMPTLTYAYSGSLSASQSIRDDRSVNLRLDGSLIGQFIVPSYAPDTTVLGGKPNFSVTFMPAYTKASADASIGSLGVGISDERTGFSDLYPTAQLFWNSGTNNWMAYVAGSIPKGSYDADRLANIGMGHAAIDLGGAYTYLNPQTGWEFSVTAGVTRNFENPSTDYTSGMDAHVDVGMAKFLTEKLFVGVVGYAYQQITPDKGQAPILGDFKSSAIGIGPQIGYNIETGGSPIYVNLRGYFELEAKNRVKGGSILLTLNIPFSTGGN